MGAVESIPSVPGCAPSGSGGGTKEESLKQSLNAIRKLQSDEERCLGQLDEEAATPSFGTVPSWDNPGPSSQHSDPG